MSVVVNGREIKPMTEAEAIYRRWIGYLNEQFTACQSADRRAEIVRDELHQIYFGRPRSSRVNATLNSEMGVGVLAESLDPRNATWEADYSPDVDMALYGPRKPLIWFWQQFDRSPLGANFWLGARFRCMLGNFIFRRIGSNVKIRPGVRFTFGYNITLEDNCHIGRDVLLDDRNELVLPAGTRVPERSTYPQS